MNTTLSVWVEGGLLGSVERGAWKFQYDADWLATPEDSRLRPPFRCGPAYSRTTPRNGPFSGSSTTSCPRAACGRRWPVTPTCPNSTASGFWPVSVKKAGALTLVPEGAPFPAGDGYVPVSTDELRQYIREQPEIPLIVAHGRAKMSLEGVQHKLGVRWTGHDFFLPTGGGCFVAHSQVGKCAAGTLSLLPGQRAFLHDARAGDGPACTRDDAPASAGADLPRSAL